MLCFAVKTGVHDETDATTVIGFPPRRSAAGPASLRDTAVKLTLRDLLKAPEIEDPVNLHVHRPLQFFLVQGLAWTGLTPNQATLIALAAGMGAAWCFLVGTRTALAAGAGLLFVSAIFDGVDGMLARLRPRPSETGTAIDGVADYLVNVATMLAATIHLGHVTGRPVFAGVLGLAAHLVWGQNQLLNDYHATHYLRFLTQGRSRGGDRLHNAQNLAALRERGAPLLPRLLLRFFVWQLGNRDTFMQRINPYGAQALQGRPVDGAAAAAYVKARRPRLWVWALLGNALHMDLMAAAALWDHFEFYFALRILGFGLLGLLGVVWERRAMKQLLQAESPG